MSSNVYVNRPNHNKKDNNSEAVNQKKDKNKKDKNKKEIGNVCKWIVVAIMALFALAEISTGGVLSGVFFLLGAVVAAPVMHDLLKKNGINIKNIVIIPLCICLFLLACIVAPNTSNETNENNTELTEEYESGISNEVFSVTPVVTPEEKVEPTVQPTPTVVPTVEPTKETVPTAVPTVEAEQVTESKTTEVSKEPEAIVSTDVQKAGEESVKTNGVSEVSDGNGDGSNFDTYDNAAQQNTSASWVLNTSSQKIHHPHCKSVKKIAPHNYATSNDSLDALLAQGYTRCGNCF